MTETHDAVERDVAQINDLLRGHTDRKDERIILDLLTHSPDLSALLLRLDLVWLIADVDDRMLGPDNRTALVDLLTGPRLADLDVPARAALILALSTGRTDALDERGIRDLFLGTRGPDLTALKDLLDLGDDHRDLQHIVFSDIDDGEVKDAILQHFAAEGQVAAGLKILSDIDDTLYANWKDVRYPKKTVYPGVLALYQEFDAEGRVSFVTARPKDRTGVIEKATHKTLRALGVKQPVVLSGSFRHLHSSASIAKKKLANFAEYDQLFPEYEFVFFGDSGQGDADFGVEMRAACARVRAVFIHDVVGKDEQVRAHFRAQGVHLFDTYVGAAAEAVRAGLLDKAAAERVWLAALSDFEPLVFDDEQARASRKAELERDAGLLAGL